ncbi:MAG: hypothetical protein Tsb0020_46830 [Haliangiales bacterium]
MSDEPASSAELGPLLLVPALRRYAWGDPRLIPTLLGLEVTGEPCAEAWFGAHPLAPARIAPAAGEGEGDALAGHREPDNPDNLDKLDKLDAFIAAHPQAILGPALAARVDGLPYLLKLLAAAQPLSIQVHPNSAQARAGFAREQAAGVPLDAPERCYRDPHHKPELLLALTEFDALCGFRPPAEQAQALTALPELSAMLPPFVPTPAGLATTLEAYFALPDARVTPALTAVLERLERRHQERPYQLHEPEYWALRADRALRGGDLDRPDQVLAPSPPDRGLLFVFLLSLIRLEPGQAIFLPAGVPHAYLHGAGVELMASSDNVLRAGLTPKHVDAAELLRVVRFEAGPPSILEPAWDEPGRRGNYAVPVSEFEIDRIQLAAGETYQHRAPGPETVLVLSGAPGAEVLLSSSRGQLRLGPGEACLVPDDLEYQLTASAEIALVRAAVPYDAPSGTFRGRHPRPLSFGTSGLRGLVEDITDLEAYINTRGFLDHLVATGDAVAGMAVAVGCDLRPSSHGPERSIVRAVVQAIADCGFEGRFCGRIPTPALAYYGFQRRIPSVMVTGSHIPFDRNGVKFNKPGGEVLKSDEAPILAAVARVRQREYRHARASSQFDDAGALRPPPPPAPGPAVWPSHAASVPPTDDTAQLDYLRRYTSAFPADALAGRRVVVYQHSAVGRDLVVEILRALGAEVHPVGRSDRFIAIDTEAITDDQLAAMQALADDVRAALARGDTGDTTIDAIVSTDGDSDRPLVLGFDSDDRVCFFGGDALGAVVADYLGVDAIAISASANDLIERHFAARGVDIVRTRIGSPWVIAAMDELASAPASGPDTHAQTAQTPQTQTMRKTIVGWESNGGFLLGTPVALPGGVLAPLPTRDAMLPIVAALHAAARAGCSLGALFAKLPPRFAHSGLLDQVDPAASRAMLRHFDPGEPSLRQVRFDAVATDAPEPASDAADAPNTSAEPSIGWRDHSGAEHRARGPLARRLAQVRAALQRCFDAAGGDRGAGQGGRGFGQVVSIDYLDGVRVGFDSGDVAHIRPSGNAPQLRIYALADTPARAAEIVALSLAEPDGVLRTLLAAAHA